MSAIPVLSHDVVLAAVSPQQAIEATRDAFVRHHVGEWAMPPKVYLDSPGYGDFRAMPARGRDLAMLKWISSFPRNPERGLATVLGELEVTAEMADQRRQDAPGLLAEGALDARGQSNFMMGRTSTDA